MKILCDINQDTVIQRYMDLSKFIDILENKHLFLSRIDLFEDKLEGGLTFINDFIYSGAANALEDLVNFALPASLGNLSDIPDNNEKLSLNKKKYKGKPSDRIFPTVFGNIELLEKSYKSVLSAQKMWLDVSCWHLASIGSENIAMWKIYGGAKNSICITTTVGQLLDNFNNIDSNTVVVSKVEYIDHQQDCYKTDHLLAPFIHKHKAYKFENEVRIITYNSNSDIFCRRETPGTTITLKSIDFINEVKVSPEAPSWFFELIKNIFNNRYKQTGEVRRSELDNLISEFGN